MSFTKPHQVLTQFTHFFKSTSVCCCDHVTRTRVQYPDVPVLLMYLLVFCFNKRRPAKCDVVSEHNTVPTLSEDQVGERQATALL